MKTNTKTYDLSTGKEYINKTMREGVRKITIKGKSKGTQIGKVRLISENSSNNNIKKENPKTEIFKLICTSLIFFAIFFLIKVAFAHDGLKLNENEPKRMHSDDFISILGLDNCRITQGELNHIKEVQGSVYATDIACIKGESFKVYAPTFRNRYRVARIGTDRRLGDYIVLTHGNYDLVFGHTKTNLKVGDRIDSGTFIGDINVTGISQDYHLHFELWKNGYNVSKNESKVNYEKSWKLLDQRGWNGILLEQSYDFIAKGFEGLELKAYPDGCKNKECTETRYSICHGTVSKKGDTTTEENCKKIFIEEISKHFEVLYKNGLGKNKHQRIALASLRYNLGSVPMDIVEAVQNQKNVDKLWMQYVKAKNPKTKEMEKLNGLEKRRKKELEKYNH